MMAETRHTESSLCSCFFLYDRSKVREEGDLTRAGIYYYYPEQTPLDQQELVCGQLAGVSRCVSEISASPVRLLRLRRSKYAIRMRDDFLWALSCVNDLPDVSMCDFLDQMIDLFCFYNGSVRRSYQLHTQEELAVCWARYLSHLQGGATELHHIFTCLTTIDYTHIDPLLLMKAALILQVCQRCPLVLAGCILHRGRMVSTQMSPELTMKVMVHETETYGLQEQKKPTSGRSSFLATPNCTTTTSVYLTQSELHTLRRPLVDNSASCRSESPKRPLKPRLLSRTLSDTPITDPSSCQMLASSPDSSLSDDASFSLCPSLASTPFRSSVASQSEGVDADESHDHDLANEMLLFEGSAAAGKGEDGEHDQVDDVSAGYRNHSSSEDENLLALRDDEEKEEEGAGQATDIREERVGVCEERDVVLEPMLLYEHRVRGLVLVLLVEPGFETHPNAKQEVYHSSLASLNGLEAHLRTIPPASEIPAVPYTFAHYDRIQNTLTTNMCGRSTGPQDRPFVKATALLHSHFSHVDMLQEAIIRSAGCALYATRTAAQETFFVQQGVPARNSGIPNGQDSAFSLPSKARHRLLKHGVNLL
ncbi:Hermansky-Pudlak syndrome 4 protein isoform X1 [Ictalurus punctatus]|uniref:Hermansky-Pudlak syndrome 4 protein isoform X1 n=1 Tax=Ictalurus punctatus TaxID=7998 RepID=A0A9F7R5V7_ICTPU|nr:Hermansky-Pudlak syndrome 4 protein isoform X1 [Ictalurus punctatus]